MPSSSRSSRFLLIAGGVVSLDQDDTTNVVLFGSYLAFAFQQAGPDPGS